MGPDRVATMLRKHFPRKVQTLSLRYVGVDGEEQLSEWEWEEHRETGDAVTELGRTIWESAQSHCEEVQTACRFALVGVAKAGSQIARQIMRQTPEDVAGVPLEEASASGLVAQSIRHTEASVRMLMQSVGQVLSMQQQMNQLMFERMRRMEKREDDLVELAQTLREANSDREAALAAQNRMDRMVDTGLEYVGPVLMNKLGLLDENTIARAADAMEAVAAGGPPPQQPPTNGHGSNGNGRPS